MSASTEIVVSGGDYEHTLGITGSQRSTLLPDLPTIAEAGLPGYEMINWLGLFAPTGTPRPIVDRLATESLRIVQPPEVRDRLNAQGAEPSPLNTDQFTPFVKVEVEKWAKIVAATGMTTADESRLFRFTIKHSIILMVVMALISMMFAYVLPGYVPVSPPK